MLFLQLSASHSLNLAFSYKIDVLNFDELMIKERENFDQAKSTNLPDYAVSLKF